MGCAVPFFSSGPAATENDLQSCKHQFAPQVPCRMEYSLADRIQNSPLYRLSGTSKITSFSTMAGRHPSSSKEGFLWIYRRSCGTTVKAGLLGEVVHTFFDARDGKRIHLILYQLLDQGDRR